MFLLFSKGGVRCNNELGTNEKQEKPKASHYLWRNSRLFTIMHGKKSCKHWKMAAEKINFEIIIDVFHDYDYNYDGENEY